MLEKLKPLSPYLRRYRRPYAWGVASNMVYNGFKVTIPLVIGAAVDGMNHGFIHHRPIFYALLLMAVSAVSGTFLYLARQILIGTSREIEYDMRNDLFRNLERQSPSFYHTHRTGDIMARATNDLDAVRQLLGPAIMYSVNTIFYMLFAIPIMYHFSPRLTLFAFVPMPIASVLVQYLGNRIHHRFEQIQAMYSDISARAQENFAGARLIRAFAQEEAEIATFETANLEYIDKSLYLVRIMAMLWPTLDFLLGLPFVIVLLIGGHQVLAGHLSVGHFTSFNVYMIQLMWPLIAVGWVVNLFQRGTASMSRIDELLKQQPDIADDPALLPVAAPTLSSSSLAQKDGLVSYNSDAIEAQISGDIELRNLTFAYADGPEVLRDINLTIPAGSSLAIVGPTGSGKTTLVSLIPRLQDAAPGMVLIDGRPIREFRLETLRKNIGFVPQETYLFSDTIRHNIVFGVPDAADEQVQDAAAIAHIRNEILEFPRGFDTMVGERGVTLSGGQKQRTAIARAVIRDPRILILDDALASVDTYTEERILTRLKQVMEGRTTLFISHRISTARNADQIAVLAHGRIAELGTHDELLARNGYYASLFEKQRLEEELSVAS